MPLLVCTNDRLLAFSSVLILFNELDCTDTLTLRCVTVCLTVINKQKMSDPAPKYFAVSIAAIWTSAAIAKIYFTKKMADVIDKHGWPKDADGNLPRSPSSQGPVWVNDLAVSGSFNYVLCGSAIAALGIWLVK